MLLGLCLPQGILCGWMRTARSVHCNCEVSASPVAICAAGSLSVGNGVHEKGRFGVHCVILRCHLQLLFLLLRLASRSHYPEVSSSLTAITLCCGVWLHAVSLAAGLWLSSSAWLRAKASYPNPRWRLPPVNARVQLSCFCWNGCKCFKAAQVVRRVCGGGSCR